MFELERFFVSLGAVVLWSAVAIIVAALFFELLDRRYRLISKIFHENSVAAAIFAGAFVVGIFYVVTQIAVN